MYFGQSEALFYIVHEYNNRVDVRGRKYVFGPTQAHFSPSRRRGLK